MNQALSSLVRCKWCLSGGPAYQEYHDKEWGRPVYDDRVHFEFLVLESAQAGLSWLIIFNRREVYREAFADFNPQIVASYSEQKIQELLHFSGIIRNEKKIRAAVQNAKAFLNVQREVGSFSEYIWSFTQGKPIQNNWKTPGEVPCSSQESIELSKDMRKRGFQFVGPKILYSHMQATGLINDHTTDCFCHSLLGGKKETLKS